MTVIVRLRWDRRRNVRLQLHGADEGLVELFESVGLSDVVHLCGCCHRCVQRGEARRGS